ncbi:hypothetical protein IQ13_3351 [Lacibacter cauensis]|uniref:Uncharacterized protein n=1 Tax=Lacibacter cauensis TaxID=510947 RepID=A0A562SHH3_9BACT|nr:hypothetical protein [Lacibacter cauensis]TWI80672.1 hypothetical protein IQ13_3351 [Lacibacter cauensis]
MKQPRLLILVAATLFTLAGNAQEKPKPTLKPPVLQSFWGKTKGGDLPLDLLLPTIDSAIWVIDDKKVKYHISRFILVYKSKDKFEDEKTGEIKTRFNTSGANVSNSPYLPANWQKNLYEIVKKEDEILITDIIVKDKFGYYYTAPDIKIKVL